ncbi:hypothetical protein [Shinella sp. M27]|uniref:hypothetical protein n=1 Tax=Shinella sp. M27 TaxID=3368614 RepID=UPI003B9F4F9D
MTVSEDRHGQCIPVLLVFGCGEVLPDRLPAGAALVECQGGAGGGPVLVYMGKSVVPAMRREGLRIGAWSSLKIGVVVMTPALILSLAALILQ